MELGSGSHPWLKADLAEPVRGCGNTAEILENVLLADKADRDLTTVVVDDAGAEDLFTEEDPFGMVPQGSVTHVRKKRLGLVKPVVNRLVIGGDAPVLTSRRASVKQGMGHGVANVRNPAGPYVGASHNPREPRGPAEAGSLRQRIRCLKSPDMRIIGFAKTLDLKVSIAKV